MSNVNVKAIQNTYRTAFSDGGHIGIVKLMEYNNANINSEPTAEFGGRTALHTTSKREHIDIAQLLLDNIADVNAERGA